MADYDDPHDPEYWKRVGAAMRLEHEEAEHAPSTPAPAPAPNGHATHEAPPLELLGTFANSTAGNQEPPEWLNEAPPPDGEHLTEFGNARRLVRQHGEDMRYCHPWGKWLVWDGKRWAPDNTGEAARRAKLTIASIYREAATAPTPDMRKALAAFAVKSEKASAIAAMLTVAESEPGIPVLPASLDADPMLITVENGTIDLRTGELRPHRRTDMITKLAPAPFDPAAVAPTWTAFLTRVFAGNDALVAFTQLWLGYCLTGDVSEHCMVVAHGNGRNGKSTLFETFAKIAGDYAGTVPSTLLMTQKNEAHPTERARLYGLRLAICSETRAGQQLDEAQLKKITGGDKIDARRMREDFWDFSPTHKLVLYTNHPPRIKTTDEGTWSKVLLLPFKVTIPKAERDHSMGAKLWADRAGILAWIVAGARRWAANGLGECKEVREATDEYRTDQDLLGPWIADKCVMDPRAEEIAKALYDSYKDFSKDVGEEKPISQNLFGRMLSERNFARKAGSQQKRLGIRLLLPVEIEARNKAAAENEASLGRARDHIDWAREPGEEG